MATLQRISTCLWFDREAEEAARFYTEIFPGSRIVRVSHYGDAPPDRAGSVLAVDFELAGQPFQALNGGPQFKFNEAVSLVVNCDSQDEVDYYWERLGAGGNPRAQQCGWLKDKYGVSWQVVPRALGDWISGDRVKANRVMGALLGMKKLDVAALERAYAG